MGTKFFITSGLLNAFFILTINAQKSYVNLVASATPEATKAGELIFNNCFNSC